MLSENIKKYRKLNNLSQDELAEKLGVSRQSISLWETGQTQPTIDNIVALAKIFGVSADALLGSESGATPPREEPPAKKKKPVWILVLIVLLVLALIGGVCAVLLNGRGSTGAASTLASSEEAASDRVTEDSEEPAPASSEAPRPASTTPVPASSQAPAFDLFAYCKSFVVENGSLNGDHVYYEQPSAVYGGRSTEYFGIHYWGDTDTIEFRLNCPLSETQSINFFLIIPHDFNGTYQYMSSRFYRDTLGTIREAKGTIDPATFSDNYPLTCTSYKGDGGYEKQDGFMEETRIGMCDLVRCLKQFVTVENMDCSFSDFGFKKF